MRNVIYTIDKPVGRWVFDLKKQLEMLWHPYTFEFAETDTVVEISAIDDRFEETEPIKEKFDRSCDVITLCITMWKEGLETGYRTQETE